MYIHAKYYACNCLIISVLLAQYKFITNYVFSNINKQEKNIYTKYRFFCVSLWYKRKGIAHRLLQRAHLKTLQLWQQRKQPAT